MPLSHTANEVLYVPFSTENTVPGNIKNKLDTNTFFNECYIRPQLQQSMQRLKNMSETEITDSEYPLKKEDLIKKYEKDIVDRKSFMDWFQYDGEGIYLIRGDAGTGKSTYVHYLKWQYSSFNWEILDIKQATERIDVLGKRLKFPKFHRLHQKVMSCIISKILSLLFVKINEQTNSSQIDTEQTFDQISFLLDVYQKTILPAVPADEYDVLYRLLGAIERPQEGSGKDAYCRKCAQVMIEYFSKYCAQSDDMSDALECAITQYLIVLRCFSSTCRKKTIIVFDNIERFIGVHEIFSNELIKFIRNLRSLVDSYKERFLYRKENKNLFAHNFQFAIAMRNTSARGFTPQQSGDFFEGSIDLTQWFSVGEIIDKKLKWLCEHEYQVKNEKRLKDIMDDFGIGTGNVVRGLRPKLDLIFNYNKRLTVEFLVEILESSSTQDKLNYADEARNVRLHGNESGSLGTFAYRSIIWRLLMDKLNEGGIFRYIFDNKGFSTESVVDLNHMRNILTVLSNYSLRNNNPYMPIEELVTNLYHLVDDSAVWFDNQTWVVERRKTAQLLFYMNYYNRRENNWFQFIDIQCNDSSYDGVHLETWDDILTMLETKNKQRRTIRIRITNAGRAYIGYIAQTFEFISCMEECRTPLLCALPTADDLLKTEIENLPCVHIVDMISKRIDHYLAGDDLDIKYERNDHIHEYPYSLRLIHSHIGYLDNFCECIDHSITSKDEAVNKKKSDLVKRIKNVINIYRSKAEELKQP